MIKVKAYTDKQLLDRVSSLKTYNGIPKGYWLLGVRSNEDTPDVYDDKMYLFNGTKFVMVTSCTTNPGKYGLLNFKEWNSQGVAVIKSDMWHYDLWRPGIHKGKMKALVQNTNVAYYRDNDKDLKSEEIGKIHYGMIGINFHGNTYHNDTNIFKKIFTWIIGKWAIGCQVCNNMFDYYKIIDTVYSQKTITYCLINEF